MSRTSTLLPALLTQVSRPTSEFCVGVSHFPSSTNHPKPFLLPLFTVASRTFCVSNSQNAETAAKPQPAQKGLLSQLRKKTGFSLANCKKALLQFDNDIVAAEKWLVEEAQKQGWDKATKLAGRAANQGLVSVQAVGGSAAMVELNCETDFVARNEQFHAILNNISEVLLSQAESHCGSGETKHLTGETLNQLKVAATSEETLKDLIALGIGNLGENMSLRRSVLVCAAEGESLATYVHAKVGKSLHAQLGKFGAILRYKATGPADSHQEIAKRLCQHVVGMNPLTLGDFDDEVTKREIRDDWVDVEVKEGEDETMVSPDKLMPVHEKDSRFLFQEFILDPSLTVKEVVVANGIQILDFVRYQSGEELS